MLISFTVRNTEKRPELYFVFPNAVQTRDKNAQMSRDELMNDDEAPCRMLHDMNKCFVARSPTTQPSVRRATTGAIALTCTTRGALSSPSWTGLLLIRTPSSPQLDLGPGMTPTWYAPVFDLHLHMKKCEPSSLSVLLAIAFFFF